MDGSAMTIIEIIVLLLALQLLTQFTQLWEISALRRLILDKLVVPLLRIQGELHLHSLAITLCERRLGDIDKHLGLHDRPATDSDGNEGK
jgi:hypothetical protein